jgi:hypothetical protein
MSEHSPEASTAMLRHHAQETRDNATPADNLAIFIAAVLDGAAARIEEGARTMRPVTPYASAEQKAELARRSRWMMHHYAPAAKP